MAQMTVDLAQIEAPTRRRFSVYEFFRMAEFGIFRRDERVKLIVGIIVKMARSAAAMQHASIHS
jgi:hypothetical protein